MEGIGTRGAIPAAYRGNPDVAIILEVGHATDLPDSDARKTGEFRLGGGPIISRGPNFHPGLFELLRSAAESAGIPVQVKAEARPAGNDARAVQISRAGVATAVVAIPLRYMHTPGEMADLRDVTAAIRLVTGALRSIEAGKDFAL